MQVSWLCWEGVGSRGSQRRLQRTVNTLFLSALLYERLETIILLISQEFYLPLTLLSMTNSYVLFWTLICIHPWCAIGLVWRLVWNHFYSVTYIHMYSTAQRDEGRDDGFIMGAMIGTKWSNYSLRCQQIPSPVCTGEVMETNQTLILLSRCVSWWTVICPKKCRQSRSLFAQYSVLGLNFSFAL
jgi:hypothetical protein